MHLWLLAACASAPTPASAPVDRRSELPNGVSTSVPVPTAAPSSPSTPTLSPPYRLVGLADDSHIPLPALPGGVDLLGPACFAVNQRLTAMDARRPGAGPPCGAERWSDGAHSFDVLWAGEAGLFHSASLSPVPDQTAQVRWNAMGPVLAACLGPPLNLPPGGDPGGQRSTDGKSWTLHLTGQNRCQLAGRLELNILADRANAREITVGGLPWPEGGAELALKRLSGEPAAAPNVR